MEIQYINNTEELRAHKIKEKNKKYRENHRMELNERIKAYNKLKLQDANYKRYLYERLRIRRQKIKQDKIDAGQVLKPVGRPLKYPDLFLKI